MNFGCQVFNIVFMLCLIALPMGVIIMHRVASLVLSFKWFLLQMPPIPSAGPGSSGGHGYDSRLVQELRDRIAAMERDMTLIFAGTAIVKKKVELALAFEKRAREELVEATNNLQCE